MHKKQIDCHVYKARHLSRGYPDEGGQFYVDMFDVLSQPSNFHCIDCYSSTNTNPFRLEIIYKYSCTSLGDEFELCIYIYIYIIHKVDDMEYISV